MPIRAFRLLLGIQSTIARPLASLFVLHSLGMFNVHHSPVDCPREELPRTRATPATIDSHSPAEKDDGPTVRVRSLVPRLLLSSGAVQSLRGDRSHTVRLARDEIHLHDHRCARNSAVSCSDLHHVLERKVRSASSRSRLPVVTFV